MAIIYIIIIGLLIWGLTELVFYLTHRRPLSYTEIKKLMEKRKKKFIKKNYSFIETNLGPTKSFKSSLKPSGQFYNSRIPLSDFPSYVANLLKGKKHEWLVVAFVKEYIVEGFYANKGYNNQSVGFNIGFDDIMNICKKNGYQTIMCFHNHPNSNPQYYSTLIASNQDKISAQELTRIALQNNINVLEFVCERGHFLEYWRCFSDNYFPISASFNCISAENSVKENYYHLQRELGIFR